MYRTFFTCVAVSAYICLAACNFWEPNTVFGGGMAIKAGCCGNFEEGLNCRMVIETKRVFDGCAFTENNITLTLTTQQQIPQQAEFVSARIVSSELSEYSVQNGAEGCCLVRGDIVTTFAVTYSSGGVLTTIAATYRETREFLLHLPSPNSLIPYTIEVQSAMNIGSGAIIGSNAVSVFGCLLQIVKVVAPVDILVPTYGYCKYPPCTGSSCSGLSSRIFPIFGGEDI